MRRVFSITVLGCGLVLASVLVSPRLTVEAQAPATGGGAYLKGGPRGIVRTSQGLPIDGLMVQLIAQKTSIRTTVYTDDYGQYEFPKLDGGDYTLRLARPIEFQQYRRDGVRIDGANALPDIVVDRVTPGEFLQPTADLLPQLSEAEWLANMPGTAHEKKTFLNACGGSCHGFQMQMRARFNEASWRKIVTRMGYQERILVQPPGSAIKYDPATKHYSFAPRVVNAPAESGTPESGVSGDRFRNEDRETVIKWLARVRGPESENPLMKPFPRPSGLATQAVVTEYELPWAMANIHDVAGDADGNIWFTINRSPFVGKLDPRSGKVTSYRVPQPDGMPPGLHAIQVGKDGNIWFTDTWSRSQAMLNPRTGDFSFAYTGQHGNVGLAPDALSLWHTDQRKIKKFDTATVFQTGQPVQEWPLPSLTSAYGNFLSRDGNFFGGGGNKIVWMNIKNGEIREAPALSGNAGSGRGDFDPDNNVWVGSKQGPLIKYDPKANVVSEYPSPTPYTNFYTARSDKNGEIWAGEMHGGRIARFNPRTKQWIEYVLPTAWSQDYQSWVDNSTNPVTYWYGDQYGYIVRVQPRPSEATPPATPIVVRAQAAAAPATPPAAVDDLDRVGQVWYRQRMGKSGSARGQEIYYMSCQICHNEYTIAADPANHAPSLKDLFKPETGVTDEAVISKIRAGGVRMPAYPKTLLTDQDLTDLVTYLREKCGTFPTTRGGGGCFDENNPPANPHYRVQ